MKKCRICLFFIYLLFLAPVLSGCSAKESKEVTLVVKAPTISLLSGAVEDDVTSTHGMLQKAGEAFAKQYTDLAVRVSVVEYENTEEYMQIEDCFDTEDAADVLFNDYFTMEAHIYSGRVVPLDDCITDKIRDDIDKSFWDQSSINGRTYMMPYFYRQNVMVYSNEWLRNAGMDEYVSDGSCIQSWSLDEWEKILEAERKVMPDTSYPLFMYAYNNQGDTHIMSLIRSQGSDFFDENMRFNLETSEGIKGLEWIKRCMDLRYMPENAADIEMISCYNMFCAGQLGFYVCNSAIEESFTDYGLVNFPSVSGGTNTNFLSGFEVFDNGDPDKLQVAKAFVRFIYESSFLDYSTCAMPCSKSTIEKYSDFLSRMQKYIDNSSKGVNFTGGNPNWLGVRDVFYKHIQELLTGEKTPEQVAYELDEAANRAIAEGLEKGRLHE